MKEIAIVGSGIMGLFQALLLANKGHQVTIFSGQSPLITATVSAGAIWMPYKASPEDKVLVWAKASLKFYSGLAKDKRTGINFRNHTEFL